MIGKTLSHYQITERIDAGGMGMLCKGRDTHLDLFAVASAQLPEWRPAPAWHLKEVSSEQ